MKKLLLLSLLASMTLFAAVKEVNLTVTGMTCQMCAASVKDTLMKTDGVKEAKIYLREGKAVVKTEKDIDMTALNAKLKAHGYHAQ